MSPAIPVHTRVVLGYSTLASFSDGQSAVLKYDYKRLFANYRITPQNVFFQQRTRSLTIDTGTAHVSAAGDPKETIKAAFDMLRLMAVTRIRQVQPTAYFAVEVKGRDLSSFVDAHVDQLRKLGFNYAAVEPIIDTAIILVSRQPSGQTVNFQYGPMGRNQWRTFGGSEALAIEGSLPAVGWGAGFFHQEQAPPLNAGLDEAQAHLLSTLQAWQKIASEFF